MKQGDIVPIFLDWQTNERELGKAKLVEKIRDGETFIIDDTWDDSYSEETYKIPEAMTIVYSYERWRVEFIETTEFGDQIRKIGDIRDHNIRYLYNIGITKSSIESDKDKDWQDIRLEDRFLMVNGVEVF